MKVMTYFAIFSKVHFPLGLDSAQLSGLNGDLVSTHLDGQILKVGLKFSSPLIEPAQSGSEFSVIELHSPTALRSNIVEVVSTPSRAINKHLSPVTSVSVESKNWLSKVAHSCNHLQRTR